MNFDLIVAVDSKNGIGKNGTLPWHLPADLKHFKEITTATSDPAKKNMVIMGRKTWESIPEAYRPLPRRLNLVLTRKMDLNLPVGVLANTDLSSSLALKNGHPEIDKVFVIGGAQIFAEALKLSSCQNVYLTKINKDFACDAFFPALNSQSWQLTDSSDTHHSDDLSYSFQIYSRK